MGALTNSARAKRRPTETTFYGEMKTNRTLAIGPNLAQSCVNYKARLGSHSKIGYI